MPGYVKALPILQAKLGTDQFLWCCTNRGCFKRLSVGHDLVEWELNVTDADVVAYYDEDNWEGIIRDGGDWDMLILPGLCQKAGVFVRTPLRPGVATRHEMPIHRSRARNV